MGSVCLFPMLGSFCPLLQFYGFCALCVQLVSISLLSCLVGLPLLHLYVWHRYFELLLTTLLDACVLIL